MLSCTITPPRTFPSLLGMTSLVVLITSPRGKALSEPSPFSLWPGFPLPFFASLRHVSRFPTFGFPLRVGLSLFHPPPSFSEGPFPFETKPQGHLWSGFSILILDGDQFGIMTLPLGSFWKCRSIFPPSLTGLLLVSL